MFLLLHVRSFTRSSRRSENITRRRDIRTRCPIITLLISKSQPETLPVSRRNPGTFFASRSGQLLQHAVSERARIDGRCRECRWNDVAVDDVTCDVVCRQSDITFNGVCDVWSFGCKFNRRSGSEKTSGVGFRSRLGKLTSIELQWGLEVRKFNFFFSSKEVHFFYSFYMIIQIKHINNQKRKKCVYVSLVF